MSEDTLLTALLEVQRDAKTLTKDETARVESKRTGKSYTYRYIGLDSIVEAVRDSLASNGLVWVTMPVSDDHGHPALLYRLAHAKTGEVLEGVMPLLLAEENAQGLGSAITYARRYSLCAVLNIVADEDDDGQKASQQARAPGSKASEPQKKKIKAQITTLKREGMTDITLRQVLDHIGFRAPIQAGWVDQLTSKQASALIAALGNAVLPDALAAGSDIPSDLPWDGEVEPVA